ncbi:MAG: ParA family protein [Clostridia bacterium]|nr:ParA family protein [Clostridia bacterium]MBR2391087.1 ParA family protein [Clostridia bacterium]
MSRIIAFANQKGGVGKTTTCVNMATFMALMGKKVLLVDMDPQGNATSNLGFSKDGKYNSIYQVMSESVPVQDAIYSTKVENLSIIPANIDLAGVEVELVYMNKREYVIKKIFEQISGGYDYITIDCPPSLGLLTINAFTASDAVIIPIQCEFFALEGLSQLMNTIRLVKKKLNADIKIDGVVLTMRDSRSNLGKQVAEEIGNFFADAVFKTTIPRNVRLAESPSYGEPIYLYDKNCVGSKSYKALVEEYFERNNEKFIKLN